MTADQLRAHLDRLGLSQMDFSRYLGKAPRSVRRWVLGETPVPSLIARLVETMTPRDAQGHPKLKYWGRVDS